MKKQTVVAIAILFLAAASPRSGHAQVVPIQTPPTEHTIFRAQGNNANAFLDGVNINGIGNAVALDVFQDQQTGETSVVLRVFTFYAGGNRTDYFLVGSIPSTDFVIAPDLSSATLTTTVNSSPGQFENPDIGPIAGLVIDLTWSPNASGHRNESFNFSSGIPGHINFAEKFHQNGTQAYGAMTGSFGAFAIDWFGELNENRTLDIVRTFLLR